MFHHVRDSVAQRRPAGGGGGGVGLATIIEQRLETPVFFVVTAMMVIRASEVFSGGALILSRLLGAVWYPRFEIATGTGMGLGSEMLMTIAGRTWRGWQREATEIASRPGLSKIQRKSLVDDANRNARHSFVFMCVGALASLYAGVMFLLTNGIGAGWGPFLGDLVAVALVDAVVLYLGVFRDARRQDAASAALANIQAGMDAALDAAIGRFRAGTSTDVDHKFIAEHLPAHQQAQFRRAVAKNERGRVWRTAQLREALGMGRDAGKIRDLNRQVLTLAKNPENGLDKDVDGRTWLIPHRTVMEIWGEEIALVRVRRDQALGNMTAHSGEKKSGLPRVAPDKRQHRAGQVPAAGVAASALSLAAVELVSADADHSSGTIRGMAGGSDHNILC